MGAPVFHANGFFDLSHGILRLLFLKNPRNTSIPANLGTK
jgi:hypothetical protein